MNFIDQKIEQIRKDIEFTHQYRHENVLVAALYREIKNGVIENPYIDIKLAEKLMLQAERSIKTSSDKLTGLQQELEVYEAREQEVA